MHEYNTQFLGFGDQALQELCPPPSISAHGRVDAAHISIHGSPIVTNAQEIGVEVLIGVLECVDVDEVIVEQLRHAIDGPFDGDIAFEKLEAIGAVVEKSVELVHVLHWDL